MYTLYSNGKQSRRYYFSHVIASQDDMRRIHKIEIHYKNGLMVSNGNSAYSGKRYTEMYLSKKCLNWINDTARKYSYFFFLSNETHRGKRENQFTRNLF